MPRSFRMQLAATTAIACVFALLSSGAAAKCLTGRIDIDGDGLTETLSISDERIASRFNVYNGPSVRVSGEPVHLDPDKQDGHFVYWPSGPLEEVIDEGRTYAVSFFCDFNGETHKLYEVDYRFSPLDEQGYIFLPGRADERYFGNVGTIVHGIEGNWFRSTMQWDRVIRPIIETQAAKPDG